MSVTQGIGKINGVAIASIAKEAGVAKANIWSIAGSQRQTSLFTTLLNSSWASFTQGKNSASFTAVGSNGSNAVVYAQYDGHVSGDSYTFSFNKTGTQSTKTFAVGVARNTGLDVDSVRAEISNLSGASTQTISNYTRGTGATIYIGIRKDSASSTDTLDIKDLVITKT